MCKTRRTFSEATKANVVRRHLVGKVPVSDLADESGGQPSQIHCWVNPVMHQAEKAFERSGSRRKGTTEDLREQ